mmetsp:Transcript_17579/g.50634  ORF Transcript_17579/g.50634 Transcript_17579/m.50634 type:complete len:117 (-) Transcript_17579:32-382(-)
METGDAYVQMFMFVVPSLLKVAREYVGVDSNGGVDVCSSRASQGRTTPMKNKKRNLSSEDLCMVSNIVRELTTNLQKSSNPHKLQPLFQWSLSLRQCITFPDIIGKMFAGMQRPWN